MDRTGQPHHHPLWSCDSQGFSVCICCIDVYLFLCGGVVMNFSLCSLVTPVLLHKQRLNYKSAVLHYNETHPHPLYIQYVTVHYKLAVPLTHPDLSMLYIIFP